MDEVRRALFLMGGDQTRVINQTRVKDGEAVDLVFPPSFSIVLQTLSI